MSERASLHPLDPELVARYTRAVLGDLDPEAVAPSHPAWSRELIAAARRGYARALEGNELGANAVTYGLARALAAVHPTFYLPGAGLTQWEARIDRGAGMLLRPPSRLFGEFGLPIAAARTMPIRLDGHASSMGGAHVPARLVPGLQELLGTRETRLVRRLVDAEMDPAPIFATLLAATAYAHERGLGLYEALDVVLPEAPAMQPPGIQIVFLQDKQIDPELRKRLEEAAKPPKPAKKPGLFARLLGRGDDAAPPATNGYHPDEEFR